MKSRKSLTVIRNLQSALQGVRRSSTPLYCWRLEKAGVKYTDEQRARMQDADELLSEATAKVKEVYAEIIGKMIVDEADRGDWR